MRNGFLAVLALSMLMPLHVRAAAPLDTSAIDAAIGFSGKMMPGEVYRVSIPRSDLHVSVDGVALKTALALGGYAVYESAPNGAIVMGDIPLLQSEVGPVQKQLTASDFEITALHNHLLREQPHVMYLHFMKIGDAAQISRQLHDALRLTAVPFSRPPAGPAAAAQFPYAAQIDGALSLKGNAHDGIYSVAVPRKDTITVHGVTLAPAMGVATAINFQEAGSGRIATTGDFVLTAAQVDSVRSALVSHGIEVTALHQHLVDGDPTLYFMHFWAAGPPANVLPGLRAAVEVVRG